MRHQRNDDQGTQHVTDKQRYAEAHFERERHDGRFDGKEQEGERCIDQRGDRRSEIAETGTTRQQVDIDSECRGVIGNRNAGKQNERADGQDRAGRIDEAVIDGDRTANGF
jgi:hypothetical protein